MENPMFNWRHVMVRSPVPPMPTDRPYSMPPAKIEPLEKGFSQWAYVGIIVLIIVLALVSFGWVFLI